MRTRKPLTDAERFFYNHAGISYMPGKETAEQGKIRGAKQLAKFEARAYARGFTYHWSVDQSTDSSEFSDVKPAWKLWQCAMYNCRGRIVNSLHAIDFGRDVKPWGQDYRRVVEAELALEGLTNTPQ